MADPKAELARLLRSKASPVLFVGSGLSRRYTGADDWEGLLKRFAAMTPRPYDYYRSKANNDLPAVAAEIAEVFADIWWDSSQFQESREKYASSLVTREAPLKVEVAEYLTGLEARLPTTGPLAEELVLLRDAVVDAVITTNYDDVLPALFPDFRPFVGQDGLLFANPQDIGELYQIHGSIADPGSLVLTSTDYHDFARRAAYLAAKLMTIFVEHPVMFLGYSLSDSNVLSVLRSIAGCLTQANIDKLRDQLIFIEWAPGQEPAVGPYTFMVDDFVLPVVRIQYPTSSASSRPSPSCGERFPRDSFAGSRSRSTNSC